MEAIEKANTEWQISKVFENVDDAGRTFDVKPTLVVNGSSCRHIVIETIEGKIEFSGKRRGPCYYRII